MGHVWNFHIFILSVKKYSVSNDFAEFGEYGTTSGWSFIVSSNCEHTKNRNYYIRQATKILSPTIISLLRAR